MDEKRSIRNLPDHLWPNVSMHVNHNEVFRATKSVNILTYKDFLPSNVNNSGQIKRFKNLSDSDEGSVSVFNNLEALKEIASQLSNIKSYSVGFTTIKRGISTAASKSGHISYYLYDYENNSPCEDFKIIEVIKK